MLMKKNIILAACLTVCLTPIAHAADVIISTTAPPPLREETPPPPRTGYVWEQGYWAWENGQYVWKSGHWMDVHPHANWVADTWDQVDSQHWRYTPGHWQEQ